MRFFLALLLAPLIYSQAPKRLEFEVASVKPVAQIEGVGAQTPASASVNPSQIRLNYLMMRDFITRAYGVRAYQVIGPDWITQERYDISATLPAGATTAQVPAMLQSLLEDRFGLKMHKSKKEFEVFVLTRSKRPFTLKEVQPRDMDSTVTGVAPNRSGGISLNLARGGLFALNEDNLDGKGMTMDMLANTLAQFIGMPTVNATEIPGFYDIHVDLEPEDVSYMVMRAAANRGVALPPELQSELAGKSPQSLFEAFDKLGLKLEKGKAPLDVINIDAVNKLPTEN